MKKYLPFALPAAAVILVIFFAVRWYQERTAASLSTPEVTAGTEIEELSANELASLEQLSQGTGNYQTVALEGSAGRGEIRFEKKDGKIYFTVTSNLPELSSGSYRLWLKTAQNQDFIASKILTLSKAGFIAATVVGADKLPLNLEVRQGETVLLTGELK